MSGCGYVCDDDVIQISLPRLFFILKFQVQFERGSV